MTGRQHRAPHHVYLMGNTGLGFFKIGLARDSQRRLKDFNLPFDVAVLEIVNLPNRGAARDLELALHGYFTGLGLRLKGEWFKGITHASFTDAVIRLRREL